MPIILPKSNNLLKVGRLSAPSFAPSINPTHPASLGLLFAAVSKGSTFIDLVSNKTGTPTSVTSTIDPLFGITSDCPSGSQIVFTGRPTVNNQNATIAAIVRPDTIPARNMMFSSSLGVDAGFRLGFTSTYMAITAGSVVDNQATFTFTAGVPYFIVASQFFGTSKPGYFLQMRLDNGAITTAVNAVTVGSTVASDGTYAIGNDAYFEPARSIMAAVMYSSNALTLEQMIAWAQDPWGFWYPSISTEFEWMSVTSAQAAAQLGTQSLIYM